MGGVLASMGQFKGLSQWFWACTGPEGVQKGVQKVVKNGVIFDPYFQVLTGPGQALAGPAQAKRHLT